MKVLVLCEYSARVRDAFVALGHDAWSCDLLETDGNPNRHLKMDCFDAIDKGEWDLIIAHPPCTALAVSGNAWYGEGQAKYSERLYSCKWTRRLWDKCLSSAKHVCFENPVGVLPRLAGFPKPTYIHPWQFGHAEQKKTGLFLHNLPPLIAEDDVYSQMMSLPKRERERLHYLPPSKDRWKIRSTTYQGIANAMARQWGSLQA